VVVPGGLTRVGGVNTREDDHGHGGDAFTQDGECLVISNAEGEFGDAVGGHRCADKDIALEMRLGSSGNPNGAVEQARKAVAKDLVTEIRTLDRQLKANAQAIARLVAATGSTLTEVVGVGPIMAGRLISRTGGVSRFLTARVCPSLRIVT
jgi:hypothetical protein